MFSPDLIEESNLQPTWNVQILNGPFALEQLKKAEKHNIPSSDKFILYTITRPDCNRIYHLFKCLENEGGCNRIL